MDGLCSGRAGKDRNFSITTRTDLETQMMTQFEEVSKSVKDLAERIGPVQTDSAGQMQSIGTQFQQMKMEIFARLDSDLAGKKTETVQASTNQSNKLAMAVLNKQSDFLKITNTDQMAVLNTQAEFLPAHV